MGALAVTRHPSTPVRIKWCLFQKSDVYKASLSLSSLFKNDSLSRNTFSCKILNDSFSIDRRLSIIYALLEHPHSIYGKMLENLFVEMTFGHIRLLVAATFRRV